MGNTVWRAAPVGAFNLLKGRPMSQSVFFRRLKFLLPLVALGAWSLGTAHAVDLPTPVVDETKPATAASHDVVLAGGCFWGLQDVFEHVKGVSHVTAGYAGGKADTAHYNDVSSGETGHAESVQITYDPSQVTLGQLLKVYFTVAHDPTELNRQGPDTGTQYRSAIFTATPEQQKIAADYIAQLQSAHSFSQPIVTQVTPLNGFYPAEDHHQDYAKLHPDAPYIVINDAPKVEHLRQQFPSLYVAG